MRIQAKRGGSPWRGLFGIPLITTASFMLLMVVTAAINGLPVRDPDGFLGPSYVRLPLIVVLVMVADVVPRVLAGRPDVRDLLRTTGTILKSRWTMPRLAAITAGLASFYLSYVAYRNLKSFLPFLRDRLTDSMLVDTDRWFTGGGNPSDILHELLGTSFTAEFLSVVYVSFLIFVPLSLAVAMVWSDDFSHGAWYVSALCFNWILGTATYYLLPSLGPVYVEESSFADLPITATSELQDSLYENRLAVLVDPHATQAVHGIAAFASLHVSIVFTAALMAQLVGLPKPVRWSLWAYVVFTALATVYFGWHYILDVPAGLAIGGLSVWLAALATGIIRFPSRRRNIPKLRPTA
ncbi:membrane-associated phospholipid phosphatase [Arthrobacter sp. CAN_A212]|uniref:phosphatase PAP2 family protein n=1 Tax=unclassified Arthrobacter TaxID=235627 RepID=UPI0018C9B34D|nr:phosphatase PAP2 family protein [Arthrobacter sp. CAN_C5]MBP2216680.1 membrane-associated phospholipid phosphatase [Arthrobacter sp. CAN_C5]